jgi:hypothetical protein
MEPFNVPAAAALVARKVYEKARGGEKGLH